MEALLWFLVCAGSADHAAELANAHYCKKGACLGVVDVYAKQGTKFTLVDSPSVKGEKYCVVVPNQQCGKDCGMHPAPESVVQSGQ